MSTGEQETVRASDVGEIRVVAGAVQFTGSGALGQKSARAQVIERAMSDAVLLALDEGHSIDDSATILAYKRWARAAVLADLGEPVDVPPRPASRPRPEP